MERKFLGNVALFLLLLSGLFTISAWAQTTDEGSGPSEQPSAPMEMGQPQSAPPPPPQAGQPPQPGQGPQQGPPMEPEAQPGGPACLL